MKQHSKVGRSAYGAASVRAMEGFVSPNQRLFEDDITLGLLPSTAAFLFRIAAIRAACAAFFDAGAPGIRGALLCRTRRIDDLVCDGIRRGLPTLVILGAGLDTRPYRLPELAGLKVLELDLPDVQDFKRKRLSRLGELPPNVHFVPVDFNTEQLDNVLCNGGLGRSECAIFVWEGVSQYLKPEAVDSILCSIARRPKPTELVFTYVLDELITGPVRPDRSGAFRRSAKRRPEPWYFGLDPLHLGAFLAERGLSLRGDFGAREHQLHYLRPMGRKLEVSEIERVAIATV